MINIKEDRIEFAFPVRTKSEKIMYELSPSSFELACISADIRKLFQGIDSKYGRCASLKLFGMIVVDIYTNEELDEALKETDEDE